MALGGPDLEWVHFTEDKFEVECAQWPCSKTATVAVTFHSMEECPCRELWALSMCDRHAKQIEDMCLTDNRTDDFWGQDGCLYNHEFIVLEPLSKYDWNEHE